MSDEGSMTLTKMIVTDSLGRTVIPEDKKKEIKAKNLAGTQGYVYLEGEPIQKDPYSFWALEVPNPTDADTRPYRVTMVNPLGGILSGLYRYPKIGEQVLVGRQGSGQNAEHFMLGYVPTAENPFNYPEEGIEDTREIFEEAGELLRYCNTAYGNQVYSEIGFRRAEKAQWPIEERDEKGRQIFPPIDVLTLDSAGNIRKTAENHLIQKAARLEILADAPEVLDRGTNAVDEAGTLPLGDYVGDDSGLHRGDLHIRAGNRIVIKADQEIRLQVGRTIVRIDDRGFNVVTKNVSGNYVNSYDTSLDMSPRNGIVLNGKSINLQAGYRLNIGDGMGATVAATMGNLNISGREISIDSYNSTEYLFHTIYQGLEYLVNAASGGMALGKADIKIADYVKYSEDSLESLVKIARKIFGLNAKRKAIRKERLKEDPPQVVLPPEAPPPEEQLSLEPLPEPQLPDLPPVEPPPPEAPPPPVEPPPPEAPPPPVEKAKEQPKAKPADKPEPTTAQVQGASHPTAEQSYGQVKSLMSAQDKTRAAAMYQKGGGGTNPGPHLTSEDTFCNQAAFDVAEATGFNTSALYGGASRLDVKATTAAKNLANAAGSIVNKVDGRGAQALANLGYTVIAAWPNESGPGHLATVRPSSKPYNDAEGPEVSNVSVTNSIKSAVVAFHGNPVSYYYDPNQQFKYDASVIAKRR